MKETKGAYLYPKWNRHVSQKKMALNAEKRFNLIICNWSYGNSEMIKINVYFSSDICHFRNDFSDWTTSPILARGWQQADSSKKMFFLVNRRPSFCSYDTFWRAHWLCDVKEKNITGLKLSNSFSFRFLLVIKPAMERADQREAPYPARSQTAEIADEAELLSPRS